MQNRSYLSIIFLDFILPLTSYLTVGALINYFRTGNVSFQFLHKQSFGFFLFLLFFIDRTLAKISIEKFTPDHARLFRIIRWVTALGLSASYAVIFNSEFADFTRIQQVAIWISILFYYCFIYFINNLTAKKGSKV